MSTKSKILAAIVALAAAFAAGRYSLPEKIRVETKTVTTEEKTNKVKTDTDRDRHVETVTTTTRKPDGTLETTTKTVQDSHTTQEQQAIKTDKLRTARDTDRETTYATSKINISLLAGDSLFKPPGVIYGLSISRPVLGPITLGAWALTDRTAGFSLGLSF